MGKHHHSHGNKEDDRSKRIALNKKGDPHTHRERRKSKAERSQRSPRRSEHSPRDDRSYAGGGSSSSSSHHHHHHHKKKLDHSHRYDPERHWSTPDDGAGHQHHHAATKIGKLIRGDSGRKLALRKKKEADKAKSKIAQANRRLSQMNAQERHEENTTKPEEKRSEHVFNLSNQGDANNVIPDDYFDNEDDSDDERSVGSNRSTSSRSEGARHHKKKKDKKLTKKEKRKQREEEEAQEEEKFYKDATEKYESAVVGAMEEGQITGDMAGRLMKKKKLEIYADDDDETRAYKLKLNSLAIEQKEVESHHKQVHGIIDEPSKEDDYKCFCYAGTIFVAYYGACIWMVSTRGPLMLVGIALGVGVPIMLIWLVVTWRQAKREGKRAIFKW